MLHQKEFKKGINTDDLRKKRVDDSFQIRKQKREQVLTKHRLVSNISANNLATDNNNTNNLESDNNSWNINIFI